MGAHFDLESVDGTTNAVFHVLRNADILGVNRDPNLVVCWGGHAIGRQEYERAQRKAEDLLGSIEGDNPLRFDSEDTARVRELLEQENLKEEWQKKRQRMLDEKVDVTTFMLEFIENYAKEHIKT